MSKASDIVDLVSNELHGWGITQDRVTSLASGITAADTSFVVSDIFGQATGITPGVVEIDSELLYVTQTDQTTKTCTLDPGLGRGYQGTTATSHAQGAKVTSRPKFPRSQILRVINDVISAVYPQLFAVKTQNNLTVTYPSNAYVLTGSPEQILEVEWQDFLGRWLRVNAYELDKYDQTLRIGSSLPLGRPLRVAWSEQPQPFTSEADDYAATGLPTSTEEVLAKGAAGRLAVGLDISRAETNSLESSDRSRVVPPNAGLNIAAALLKEYDNLLQGEARSLRRKYPPRVVKRF